MRREVELVGELKTGHGGGGEGGGDGDGGDGDQGAWRLISYIALFPSHSV